jgi:hypothetical protein
MTWTVWPRKSWARSRCCRECRVHFIPGFSQARETRALLNRLATNPGIEEHDRIEQTTTLFFWCCVIGWVSHGLIRSVDRDNRPAEPVHFLHKFIHAIKGHLKRGGTTAPKGVTIMFSLSRLSEPFDLIDKHPAVSAGARGQYGTS